jgi:uncharacterized protein
MTVFLFTLIILCTGVIAGLIGSLSGLGGGVIIIPVLTLLFQVDIRYAIGATLVSVIATSSGAGASYVKDGYTNIRIGMFLEIATTTGALTGAYVAGWFSPGVIAVIFGLVLLHSVYASNRKTGVQELPAESDFLADRLRMNGSYPAPGGPREYQVTGVPLGTGLMFLAGCLSGLLGIGSGAMKVLAMDRAMRVPFKVSTTTSNFMIGVTAAASAGVYLSRGYIDPGLAMPVMLGVLCGSLIGARILPRVRTGYLRLIFSFIIFLLALEMIYKGVFGKI